MIEGGNPSRGELGTWAWYIPFERRTNGCNRRGVETMSRIVTRERLEETAREEMAVGVVQNHFQCGTAALQHRSTAISVVATRVQPGNRRDRRGALRSHPYG